MVARVALFEDDGAHRERDDGPGDAFRVEKFLSVEGRPRRSAEGRRSSRHEDSMHGMPAIDMYRTVQGPRADLKGPPLRLC